MLIHDLFAAGIMTMGPSKIDPERQVGVFNSMFISNLSTLREKEMEKVRWLVGEWNYENEVPATSLSPAYTDVGVGRFKLGTDGSCINLVARDGTETPNITFDPFSKQWIYMVIRGSYGILRSPQGWIDKRIVLEGLMTMIGVNCDWRLTLTKVDDDRFSFVNEERNADASWAYIDEWRFTRRS
jgi:hypothetical protein